MRTYEARRHAIQTGIEEAIKKHKESESKGKGISLGLPERMNMTPEEWASVPDNTGQRDTELHARGAHHLYKKSPAHLVVNMAQAPDGRRWKLDGHTRSYLWSTGKVTPPEMLAVDVYEVQDEEDAEVLYRHFDNKDAAETSKDQLASAARINGIKFESAFMRRGQFAMALKDLSRMAGMPVPANDQDALNRAVFFYKEPLEILDSMDIKAARFPSGILMGALAILKRYGKEAEPYLKLYQEDAGIKDGKLMDAVEALGQVLMGKATGQSSTRSVAQRQNDIFRRTLTAYEAWRNNEEYTQGKGGGARPMRDRVVKLYVQGLPLRGHRDNVNSSEE